MQPNEKYMPVNTYGNAAHRSSGRGIWSYDDLHAFQRRSTITKILRILGFILVWGVLVTIGVILLIFLFVRPPNIGVENVNVPNVSQSVTYRNDMFQFPISIDVQLNNPNTNRNLS